MVKSRFLLPAITFAAISYAAFFLPAVSSAQLKDPANLAGERVSPPALADTLPINHRAAALQQLLLKLRTRASLMMIVAHPDDEDGGMLTYESRGQGARVAMLTLTRGEGGQNLMSADFDDALGLIRTQELLAADRYFGVDQFFGTEVDFGFSKTKEETFAKWTHDRVLYDAVRSVRLYRPLVLASVFVGGPTDGHGQHQVSGEIAQEVFLAAADPRVFPEMIAEGLLPWAPLKVYARVPFSRVTREGMYDYATGKTIPTRFHNYVTGKDSTAEPTATVEIPEGDKSTALGMDGDTYVQFARKGLALQKTQIGNTVRLAPAGAFDVGYTLMASRVGCPDPSSCTGKGGGAGRTGLPTTLPKEEKSLFQGIDTSLPGIATLAPGASPTLRVTLKAIDGKIAEAQKLFDPGHLEASAPPLREALRTLDTLLASVKASPLAPARRQNLLHELRLKRVQLNDALVLALNLTLESTPRPPHPSYASPFTTIDRSVSSNVLLTNHSAQTVTVQHLTLNDLDRTAQPAARRTIASGGSLFAESDVRYPHPPSPTRPYFSRLTSEQPFYDIADPALRNAPATPPPFVASATVELQGVPIEVRTILLDPESVLIRDAPPETRALLNPALVPQAAVIIPPVSIDLQRASKIRATPMQRALPGLRPTPASSAGILPLKAPVFDLGATLGIKMFEDSLLGPATMGPAKVPVTLLTPPDWHVSSPIYDEHVEPVTEYFTVTPRSPTAGQQYHLTAKATFNAHDYTEGFRAVGYPGLTYTNFYTPATYRATAVDVTTAPDLHIAYLPGTGDTVPNSLPNLGISPTILTLKDLTPENLKQYDAVVFGVRAYAAHPELEAAGSQPLLAYANAGGVVIVQYMTARYGDTEAPYPIAVPGDPAHNVVEEAQPVTLLHPDDPLLTWPNRITSADFDHWVAERGHGFAASWDPHFVALTETHDVGQDPQKGGLLLARTGRGAYVYVAYALYRQLPEGVPGAYRIFANLLSFGKNPNRIP